MAKNGLSKYKAAGAHTAPVAVVEEEKPKFYPRLNGKTNNVLLNFEPETLQRLEKHLIKLQELHFFIPKKPGVTPDQLQQALQMARSKGGKEANEFLKKCRESSAAQRRQKPSLRSFVYNLICIGLEAYEVDVEKFQDEILNGRKRLKT